MLQDRLELGREKSARVVVEAANNAELEDGSLAERLRRHKLRKSKGLTFPSMLYEIPRQALERVG